MATDIASLGIRVKVLEADRAKRDLDDLTRKSGRAEKATSGLSTAVKALASAYVLVKAVQYAKEAATMAARYETLGVVMHTVGKNAGYTAEQMDDYAQSLRDSGIAMIESRSIVTRMTQAHIDLANSTKLARIAQDAAVIGNINSSEAFSRLTRGIQTAQTEVLRTIGINVSFEQSYKKLASQLGKSAKDLTLLEKTQARVNGVMEAGSAITGSYEASMDTAGKQVLSLKRYHDDLKVTLGAVFNNTTLLLVNSYTSAIKDVLGNVEDLKENGKLDQWSIQMAEGVLTAINGMLDGFKLLAQAVAGFRAVFGIVAKEVGEFKVEAMTSALEANIGRIAEINEKLDSKVSTFLAGGREQLIAQRTELEKLNKGIVDALPEWEIFAKAGDEMAADNVAKMDEYSASIDRVKGRLKGALADMIALSKASDVPLFNSPESSAAGNYGPIPGAGVSGTSDSEAEAAAAKNLSNILDNNAKVSEQLAARKKELNIAIMADSEREIFLIREKYDALSAEARQLAMLGEISETTADKMQKVFGEQMQEDLDTLGDKGVETASRMEQAFMGWGNQMSSSLNEMAWGADLSFSSILESFAKMITQMIIQIQIVEPMMKKVGGFDWSSLLSSTPAFNSSASAATGNFGPMPSAAGGYDIPSGVNPVTQLHEREMVLPAKYADVIRNGGSGGTVINQTIQVDARGEQDIEARLSKATKEGAERGFQMVLKDLKTRGPVYQGAKA